MSAAGGNQGDAQGMTTHKTRPACKPHSVRRETRLDGHLSGLTVARQLVRSTQR